ncbi:MAG: serine hydrolase [Phycisphaeraceae bacterium]|nr:serine hydrolase [Phycisphaeraceae bacterium]MCB9848820.1 serine hydrolase [Phycisphaeraceae bacterium]
MKRFVLCLTLPALSVGAGCATSVIGEPPTARIPEAAAVVQGLEPEVTVVGEPGWSLEERMAHYKVRAVSIAVIDNYEIVWAEAFGLADAEGGVPATTDTLFLAGSISKPVAAAAVLAAAQNGELDLDAPINTILTSWKLPENEFTAVNPVTPRRLLSHTGGTTVHGFAGYPIDADVPTIVQVLDGVPPANSPPVVVDLVPGAQLRYSGGGTTVMQLAMTDLAGLPYPEMMRRRVLGPIGMTQSTYEQPLPPGKLKHAAVGYLSNGAPIWGKRHTYPEMAAAGLWTTATDLARFLLDVQKALRGDAGTLLSRETALEMITPVRDGSGLGFFQVDWGGGPLFSHGGVDAGFQAFAVASPEGGRGLVMMGNSDNFGALALEIRHAVTRAFDWPGISIDPVVAPDVSADKLDELAGRYLVRDDSVIELTREGDRLMSRWLLSDDSTWWIPTDDDEFITQSDGARFRFERNEAGEVTGYFRTDEKELRVRPRLPDDYVSYMTLLDAGRTGEAIDKLRAGGMDENALNLFGYRLLDSRPQQAVAVFRLLVEMHPDSANASDSLGDGYIAIGDKAAAAESFRQAAEKLAADDRIPEDEKPAFESRARTMIRRYGGG